MLSFMRNFRRTTAIVSALLSLSTALPVFAYEVTTHTSVTEKAAERSSLDQGVLADLGLGSLKATLSGRLIKDWLMLGADFEDSTIPVDPEWPSSWARYRNHFYNPINGQGYDFSNAFVHLQGMPSPTWGLEDRGDIEGQNHSLKDAYGFLLAGLTLPTKSERDERLTQLFQTLGHTVHLVQDAAQPQHTRNDSHALGSLYERYVLELTEKKKLQFGDYPIVTSPTARDFFHTQPPGPGNVLVGKGIAEYSNRGFVTTETNFKGTPDSFQAHTGFPTPNEVGAVVSTKNIRDFAQFVPPYFSGDITFIETTVPDTYKPAETKVNPYTSSYSIFNADLNAYLDAEARDNPSLRDVGPDFAFNKISANAAQQFLIPRAVSYSAGLINWFFRGKIDMIKDPDNASQYLIKNLGTESLQGTFKLYYDNTSDMRHEVPGAQWETTSYAVGGVLADDSEMVVPDFVLPSDIKEPTKFVLVFNGTSTPEAAGYIVVARLVDLNPVPWQVTVAWWVRRQQSNINTVGGCSVNYYWREETTFFATIYATRATEAKQFELSNSGSYDMHSIDSCSSTAWTIVTSEQWNNWIDGYPNDYFPPLVINGERVTTNIYGNTGDNSTTTSAEPTIQIKDFGVQSVIDSLGRYQTPSYVRSCVGSCVP